MAGQRDYSAEELDAELPDLRRTLAALGALTESDLSADQFLELLRQRAQRLQEPAGSFGAEGLGEAIRRALQA